jgi:hypothetical protein
VAVAHAGKALARARELAEAARQARLGLSTARFAEKCGPYEHLREPRNEGEGEGFARRTDLVRPASRVRFFGRPSGTGENSTPPSQR